VGFHLSGVLWRALPSSEPLSAGRVQSAALRLVCRRECEIERHRKVKPRNLNPQPSHPQPSVFDLHPTTPHPSPLTPET